MISAKQEHPQKIYIYNVCLIKNISGHTMQYTCDVLLNCTLEAYVLLLTSVTPINLIFKCQNAKKNSHS